MNDEIERPKLALVEPDIESVHNIPRILRKIADEIETGELPVVKGVGVFLTEDDEVVTFGWGRLLSNVEAIGLYHIGADTISEGVRAFGEKE